MNRISPGRLPTSPSETTSMQTTCREMDHGATSRNRTADLLITNHAGSNLRNKVPQGRKGARGQTAPKLTNDPRPITLAPHVEEMHVESCIRAYLSEITPRKAPTTQRHHQIYAAHLARLIGHLPITKITSRELYLAQQRLAATPYMANRVVSFASCLIAFSECMGWRPGGQPNPTLALTRFPEPHREEWLELEERLAFIEAAHMCARDARVTISLAGITLLMLLAGFRLREATLLRWSEIDFSFGVVRLLDRAERGSNKTNSQRSRPITDDVVRLLRSMPAIEGCDWVFPNPRRRPDGHLYPYVDIRKGLWRILGVAGLDIITCHGIRHAFATALAGEGFTAEQIAGWLGHQSAATAQRYLHLSARNLLRNKDRVAAAITGAAVKERAP